MTLGLMVQSFAATDLMDIYHQALENDPIFKNAYDTYMANKEALPQAWAALLPQAGLTAQTTRNFLHVNDGFFPFKTTITSPEDGNFLHHRLFSIIKLGQKYNKLGHLLKQHKPLLTMQLRI